METDGGDSGFNKRYNKDYSGKSGGNESKSFGGSGTSGFRKGKGKPVCKFFVQGNCKSDHCGYLHAYSPIENIDLKASAKVSESSVHDICTLAIDGKSHIITLNSEGQIAVFSPDENKVIESFFPDGQATCVRVFPQFSNILFVAYTKQAPGGSLVGILLAQAGSDRMEVEAHDGAITDINCMSINDPQFTGEVFFTSSLDCKIKAWRIEGGTLSLLHSLDSPSGSAVNCLSCANSELVFGGCADGSIIAWNILHNSSDEMRPENMNTVIQLLVYQSQLIVVRDDKQIDIYDMANSFLMSTTFSLKSSISSVCISQDAIGCDVLVVGSKTGYFDLFNISHGFKQFTTVTAYVDSPVNKLLNLTDFCDINKGLFSVSSDGCVSVWQWQNPKKKDFSGGWDSSRGDRGGRRFGGGYRGRGRGRGPRGGNGFQGGQGSGF